MNPALPKNNFWEGNGGVKYPVLRKEGWGEKRSNNYSGFIG
jgi:hypothetical protein